MTKESCTRTLLSKEYLRPSWKNSWPALQVSTQASFSQKRVRKRLPMSWNPWQQSHRSSRLKTSRSTLSRACCWAYICSGRSWQKSIEWKARAVSFFIYPTKEDSSEQTYLCRCLIRLLFSSKGTLTSRSHLSSRAELSWERGPKPQVLPCFLSWNIFMCEYNQEYNHQMNLNRASMEEVQGRIDEYEVSLANLFWLIIGLEQEIENSKVNLAENNQFDLGTAFHMIDVNRKGYILQRDFMHFFAENRVGVQEDDCYYLVSRYATQDEQRLFKQDLYQMLIPKRNPTAAQKVLTHQPHRNVRLLEDKFPFFIQKQLCALLEKEVECYRQVEQAKMHLMNQYGWNTMDAFLIIDRANKLRIDYDSVDGLLKRADPTCKFSMKDFQALMARINQDGNDTIEKDEFCDAIMPNMVYKQMGRKKEDPFHEGINTAYLKDKQQARRQTQVPNQQALIKQHLASNSHQYAFLRGNVNLPQQQEPPQQVFFPSQQSFSNTGGFQKKNSYKDLFQKQESDLQQRYLQKQRESEGQAQQAHWQQPSHRQPHWNSYQGDFPGRQGPQINPQNGKTQFVNESLQRSGKGPTVMIQDQSEQRRALPVQMQTRPVGPAPMDPSLRPTPLPRDSTEKANREHFLTRGSPPRDYSSLIFGRPLA